VIAYLLSGAALVLLFVFFGHCCRSFPFSYYRLGLALPFSRFE
jgi:hypothetical protein